MCAHIVVQLPGSEATAVWRKLGARPTRRIALEIRQVEVEPPEPPALLLGVCAVCGRMQAPEAIAMQVAC